MILVVSSLSRVNFAWTAAWANLRGGLEITAQQPGLYVKLVLLYSLSAAVLAASWQLGWVAVQSTRGLLIPALHTAYEGVYTGSRAAR